MTGTKRTRGTPATASPAASPAAGPGAAAAAALAAALALGAVFVLALQPLWATDLGWQLRVGRDLLARGVPAGIPHVDTLSWSAAGRPWIELRWLWALAIAGLERAGGYAAISWAAAALTTLAFGLAGATAVRRGNAGAAWAAPVTLAAALASQQRFLARPETATFVFVAAFVLVLHRAAGSRSRAAWLLPALQVAWVNTHTLFALGPVLVALSAVAGVIERRGTLRRDAALLVATLAACLVNPYGWGALAFAWTVFGELHAPVVRAAIRELVGPFAVEGDFTNLRWFTGLLVAVPLVAALAWWRARRLDAFLALATAAGAALALTSVRNLPLFALPAVPFLVHHLAIVFAPARTARVAALGAPVAGALLAVAILVDVTGGGFYARQGDPRRFGAGLAPSRYPVRAALVLRERGVADRVFATFHESSWLLAEGFRSYLDPRIEVFGPAFLERALRAQADAATWAALAREAAPSAVVVGLEHRAFVELLEGEGWGLAWFDDVAALYLPAGSAPLAPRPLVLEGAVRAFPPPALTQEGSERFAGFLLLHDRRDLAGPYLAGATRPAARLALALALEARGDTAAAHREREAAYRAAPDDPVIATEWALELLAQGRVAEAAGVLDPILKHPDAPARAWALRGEAHGAAGDLAAAESCLARAAALDPANENIRRRLDQVRRNRGSSGP